MEPKWMKNGTFFTGINYWASHAAIHMWSDWRADVVEADFQKLSQAGIQILRVFPLWPVFQPLTAIYANAKINEYRFGEKALPDTKAGRAGVSEEACDHFAQLCKLAEKYHLQLVVGLLTGHMSFRFFSPPAFEGKNFLSDPTTIKWEIRFVKYFVQRFCGEKSIVAWDLGNECNCMSREPNFNPDQAYVWTSAITDAIRTQDSKRPVVSGMDSCPVGEGAFNLEDLGEQVDILTVHPYHIFRTNDDPILSIRPIIDPALRVRVSEDIGGKPCFVEETGAIGYLNCSEAAEADYYRCILFDCWAKRCHGLMWWCAFDQGEMDYAPYDWNNIGSDYGFFRKDGSPKPLVEENLKFHHFLKALPFDALPAPIVDGVCLLPRQLPEDFSQHVLRTATALAAQANIHFSYSYALEPIPDAPVYFMCSVDGNHALYRRRLLELLEKVKNGAVFYLSLGDTLFRWIPELTGLTVRYRERSSKPDALLFENEKMPIGEGYLYTVEKADCEVLARAEDGRPVFVRRAYGRGWIYLLTTPVEKMLSRKPGAFHDPDAPRYEKIYRKVMEKALSQRVADFDNRLVRMTEHPFTETDRLLVMINYSDRIQEGSLQLNAHWHITECYYGGIKSTTLKIPANDAVVLRIQMNENQK